MGDFFAFRMLITPRFIQILFVLGLIGLVIAFAGAASNEQALAGILILAFGTLYWRILCELFFVLFRINDTLTLIKADTTVLAPAPAGAGTGIVDAATASTAELAPAVTPRETEQQPAVTATTVGPIAEAAPAASPPTPEPASAPTPTLYCENCGAERSPTGRFCTSCGHE